MLLQQHCVLDGIFGDYTRLDETILVLIAAAAGRRGPKWGSRPPEGRAIAGLKAALIPTEGLFFAAKGAIKTK